MERIRKLGIKNHGCNSHVYKDLVIDKDLVLSMGLVEDDSSISVSST